MPVGFVVNRTKHKNKQIGNWSGYIQHGVNINGEARSVQKRKRLSGIKNYLQIINCPKGLVHKLAFWNYCSWYGRNI